MKEVEPWVVMNPDSNQMLISREQRGNVFLLERKKESQAKEAVVNNCERELQSDWCLPIYGKVPHKEIKAHLLGLF